MWTGKHEGTGFDNSFEVRLCLPGIVEPSFGDGADMVATFGGGGAA